MIEFQYIWAFLFLPLPLLVYFALPEVKRKNITALIAPFYQQITSAADHVYLKATKNSLLLAVLSLSWISLVISSANPQWVDEPIAIPTKGRNLMLAVDLSESMQELDFQHKGKWVDRLTATKIVASDFVERRKGDHLGLILFADQAYVQTPLTYDRKTVQKFLDESVLGLAGQSTAIGDAIGLAIKKMSHAEQKVLILLTDGANTAGNIEPMTAAELAADEDIKIYTIGIGSTRSNFSSLLRGQGSRLDEKTLQEISAVTGGSYFKASNLSQLQEIYATIDTLEPITQEQQYFRPQKTLYYWPLLVGTMCLTLLCILVLYDRRVAL
ncbi:MAG: VWA domain-containing protein [Deltaproteobacteria bacterium]|nr:VWA domain-containing protein [Deltaproteobacteria bacterium]